MQWYVGAFFSLQADFLDQTAVLHHCLVVDYHYLRPSAEVVNAHLQHVAVDPVEDLSVSTCAYHVLPTFFFDDYGGEDGLCALWFM